MHVQEHDYYRFSRRAVRDVFLDGLERVEVAAVLDPPWTLGHGLEPMNSGPAG